MFVYMLNLHSLIYAGMFIISSYNFIAYNCIICCDHACICDLIINNDKSVYILLINNITVCGFMYSVINQIIKI